jgi:hypothetical protein
MIADVIVKEIVGVFKLVHEISFVMLTKMHLKGEISFGYQSITINRYELAGMSLFVLNENK